MDAILLIVYLCLGYWATNQTIYANKIRIGNGVYLWMSRVVYGAIFGWILIPWAIIKKLLVR